jgi:small subunit ribosomal protein S1
MNPDATRSEKQNLSFSSDDFAKALDNHDYQYDKGQVVKGKVFKYESDGAYVDFGGKAPGFIPNDEVSVGRVADISQFLPLDEELEFLVISYPDSDGQLKLSRRLLEIKKTWDQLSKTAEQGKSVQFRVTGVNKGGVLGEVEGLRGFIPRSHLAEQNNLDSLMGQLLTATFLEVDRERKRLVLSQREASRADAIRDLQLGALMEGKVVNFKPYGVFVDIEGLTGLLHIKEISDKPIASIPSLFQIGQIIKVMVINIDEFKNRISLSTKILESYGGELLENFSAVMDNAPERADNVREKLLSGEYFAKQKKEEKTPSPSETSPTEKVASSTESTEKAEIAETAVTPETTENSEVSE